MNMEKLEKVAISSQVILVNTKAWLACKREPHKAIKQLRKLKSRAMVDAMTYGEYTKGNHTIKYFTSEVYQMDMFSYYYRGTLIAIWIIDLGHGTSSLQFIDAGEFESTTSTRQQRQEIQSAVLLFKEVYEL